MADRAVELAATAHPELARRHCPGRRTHGNDPDGFMTMPEVVEFIGSYATSIDAPVQTGTTVTRVATTETGYQVATDRGVWNCATVVLASGACNVAKVPAIAAAIPSAVANVTPLTLSVTRPTRRRRGARRRWIGDRRATRRRDPPQRPARHPRRRRARDDAAHLPRPRHLLVDGEPLVCSTSATTRSTISSGPATSRRRN